MAKMKDGAGKSTLTVVFESKRGKRALFIPPAVAVAGYVAGLTILGPKINKAFPTDFHQFFSTSAQVIATLLVVLAVEQAVFESEMAPTTKLAAQWGLVFVALGEVAAVLALSVRLSEEPYRQAFAVTVGSGLAALVAVVLTGWRRLSASAHKEFVDEMKLLAQVGDRGAKAWLDAHGEGI
jgi:hypothetical protein